MHHIFVQSVQVQPPRTLNTTHAPLRVLPAAHIPPFDDELEFSISFGKATTRLFLFRRRRRLPTSMSILNGWLAVIYLGTPTTDDDNEDVVRI